MVAPCHEGSKSQRLTWIGNSEQILTQGWSAYMERQYAVWDPRDLTKPLTLKKLDNNNQQANLHYDDDTKTVFILNKGHPQAQMFFMHKTGGDNGTPTLQLIDSYKGEDNAQGWYFLPKRNVDFMSNELNRALRHNGKII